jgi:hypothetical protein
MAGRPWRPTFLDVNPIARRRIMRHEIDTRINATGDQVTLYWYPRTGRVCVEVESDEESARVFVEPETALDAFHHPFLYLEGLPVAA